MAAQDMPGYIPLGPSSSSFSSAAAIPANKMPLSKVLVADGKFILVVHDDYEHAPCLAPC